MLDTSPSINLQLRGLTLNNLEVRRIERQLRRLARRLDREQSPLILDLRLIHHAPRQEIEAQLRVQEGHLGPKYVADATTATADKSVRIAVARIERQLTRRSHRLRGSAAYGVPSRRFPERRRLSRALRARRAPDTEIDSISDDNATTEES